MITKEQAAELRRLIGAHVTSQVTIALCGEVSSAYAADRVVADSCRLLEFISRITEDDSWDSDRRPGGDGVGVGE